jgi:multiple sugar transport system permease protein
MSRPASLRLSAPWLLIAPSLILALFIISYPVFNIVYQSLHDVSRFGAIRDFTGLKNFYTVFTDPEFLGALRRTIYWTFFVVGGTVLISVPVALIWPRRGAHHRDAAVVRLADHDCRGVALGLQ